MKKHTVTYEEFEKLKSEKKKLPLVKSLKVIKNIPFHEVKLDKKQKFVTFTLEQISYILKEKDKKVRAIRKEREEALSANRKLKSDFIALEEAHRILNDNYDALERKSESPRRGKDSYSNATKPNKIWEGNNTQPVDANGRPHSP